MFGRRTHSAAWHYATRGAAGVGIAAFATAAAPVVGPFVAGAALVPFAMADHRRGKEARKAAKARKAGPIGRGTAVGEVKIGRLHRTA